MTHINKKRHYYIRHIVWSSTWIAYYHGLELSTIGPMCLEIQVVNQRDQLWITDAKLYPQSDSCNPSADNLQIGNHEIQQPFSYYVRNEKIKHWTGRIFQAESTLGMTINYGIQLMLERSYLSNDLVDGQSYKNHKVQMIL